MTPYEGRSGLGEAPTTAMPPCAAKQLGRRVAIEYWNRPAPFLRVEDVPRSPPLLFHASDDAIHPARKSPCDAHRALA